MRRGGKQLNVNNQSITKVNLIRLVDETSLLANGEVLHHGQLGLKEREERSQMVRDSTDHSGRLRVVEDGMAGRWHELTWYASAGAVNRRGRRTPRSSLEAG